MIFLKNTLFSTLLLSLALPCLAKEELPQKIEKNTPHTSVCAAVLGDNKEAKPPQPLDFLKQLPFDALEGGKVDVKLIFALEEEYPVLNTRWFYNLVQDRIRGHLGSVQNKGLKAGEDYAELVVDYLSEHAREIAMEIWTQLSSKLKITEAELSTSDWSKIVDDKYWDLDLGKTKALRSFILENLHQKSEMVDVIHLSVHKAGQFTANIALTQASYVTGHSFPYTGVNILGAAGTYFGLDMITTYLPEIFTAGITIENLIGGGLPSIALFYFVPRLFTWNMRVLRQLRPYYNYVTWLYLNRIRKMFANSSQSNAQPIETLGIEHRQMEVDSNAIGARVWQIEALTPHLNEAHLVSELISYGSDLRIESAKLQTLYTEQVLLFANRANSQNSSLIKAAQSQSQNSSELILLIEKYQEELQKHMQVLESIQSGLNVIGQKVAEYSSYLKELQDENKLRPLVMSPHSSPSKDGDALIQNYLRELQNEIESSLERMEYFKEGTLSSWALSMESSFELNRTTWKNLEQLLNHLNVAGLQTATTGKLKHQKVLATLANMDFTGPLAVTSSGE